MPRSLLAAALAAGTALFLAGCQPALWVGIQFVYDEADLPAGQIKKDLAYAEGPSADPEKHRLDLFLPAPSEENWPTVIFVHGGGWTEGDKDLRVGYQDVYGNIGRFFAARGIGAAVINYRLLGDGVQWPAQIEDVARATAYVHDHIAEYGGDPAALFLMGTRPVRSSPRAWRSMRPRLRPSTLALRHQGRDFCQRCGTRSHRRTHLRAQR